MNTPDIMGPVVGAAIGAVDQYLEDSDAAAVPARVKTLEKRSNMLRIGSTLAGMGLQMFMPRYGRWGEVVAISGATLLGKTVYVAVKAPAGAGYRPKGNPTYSAMTRGAGARASEFDGIRKF